MISNNKISVRQLQIMIILQSIGTGIVMLPSAADGRILPLAAAAVLDVIYSMLICRLDNINIFDMTKSTFGSKIGRLLILLLSVFLIIYCGCCLITFSDYVSIITMQDISPYIIAAFILISSLYGVLKGIEALGRCSEILFLFIFLPMLLVYILGMRDGSLSNIEFGFNGISRGLPLSFCMSGAWLILLTGGYINGKRKNAVSAVWLAAIITVFVSAVTTAFFGGKIMSQHSYAVLEMMYSFADSTFFVNRLEAVVMCFWISAVFLQLSYTMFFITDLTGRVFGTDRRKTILPSALAVFAASFVFFSEKALYTVQSAGGIIFLLLLPIIITIKGMIKK